MSATGKGKTPPIKDLCGGGGASLGEGDNEIRAGALAEVVVGGPGHGLSDGDNDGAVTGVGQIFGQQVLHPQPHETRVGAVGARDKLRLGDGSVDDQLYAVVLIVDQRQHRGGAMGRTHHGDKVLLRGKGHARNSQSSTEILGDKRFVGGHDIEPEAGLLAVGDEDRFDDGVLQFGPDGDAGLHGGAVTGVDAQEGDVERGEGFEDSLLSRRLVFLWHRAHGFADVGIGHRCGCLLCTFVINYCRAYITQRWQIYCTLA